MADSAAGRCRAITARVHMICCPSSKLISSQIQWAGHWHTRRADYWHTRHNPFTWYCNFAHCCKAIVHLVTYLALPDRPADINGQGRNVFQTGACRQSGPGWGNVVMPVLPVAWYPYMLRARTSLHHLRVCRPQLAEAHRVGTCVTHRLRETMDAAIHFSPGLCRRSRQAASVAGRAAALLRA
jgi:hypothetical protein